MCPACGSKDLRHSQKRWTDFFALLVNGQPVRCQHCDNRSYTWPWMRGLSGGKMVEDKDETTGRRGCGWAAADLSV